MADYTNLYKHLQSRPVVKQGLPNRSPSVTKESVKKEPDNTPNMAGTQQYSFPPPPPPPGPPPHHQQQQQQQPTQYGYAQPPLPQYQQPRGGGPPRGGRGGMQGGRGDFHAPSFPHPQPSYNGPPQGYNGPQNHQQNPAPYIGPQAHPPQAQGPHNAYGPPQWQNNEQHGPPHHGQPPMAHPQHAPHAPHAAPLAASNYHPNYAPQVYQQQSQQYGPQQPLQQQQPPPQFQNPQQFGHQQHQPPHGGPPQWTGPPLHNQQQQQQQQQFNARGRGGRGGFTNGRGGHEAPLMGPPIRMGFDNERGDHMAQAGPGFPQPYASHPTPPVPFSQPFNQGYSPHFPQAGQRPPIDPNPYNSQNRGRGGNMNNFRGGRGGRGDFNNQFRGRDNRQFSNGGPRPSDNSHKPAGADANGKKKKKRRTNTLGLTPNGVDHEDSDEEIDDVDEEARLVTLLGPDTPQLPTDLEAWLEERRSRFPTKARREAAAEELRQRIEQGLQVRAKKESSNGVSIKKEEGESKLEKQQRKAEKLRLELEKAERRIQESLSGSKRKRETGDEGDDARGSDGESDDSSESDTESKPETMSSRNGGSMRMPPAPKAQLQRHCKYFSTGGTCGKKGKCRFVHDQEVRNQALRDKEANGGKMTLAQRLILNDTAKDDLTILKSIKYLKEKGLMSEQLTANASRNDDDDMAVREENGYENNLSYGDS